MTLQDVMTQLQECGTEQNRIIYTRHGCDIDQYGVSMANLKKVLKPIKNDRVLGKELFLSNNADAIYVSQWIVRLEDISTEEIEDRVLLSNYYMLIENAIPPIVAQDLTRAKELLARWLHHEEPRFRQCGYNLYANLIGIYPDESFDMTEIKGLLEHIKKNIHEEANRVRYTMNTFVISVGTYLKELSPFAKDVAQAIGKVDVNMGETSCKVPEAYSYIEKVQKMNRVGTKRKR